jgi:membrane AbrB-like protein
MTSLAEREGARIDLEAGAHAMRVLVVTVVSPFVFAWSGLSGADGASPVLREVRWLPLLALMAVAVLASGLMMRLRLANPWFIGPLTVAATFALAGLPLSAMPPWASPAAQLLIGVSMGVRFRREFLGHAPRWIAMVVIATLVAIVLCVGFAWEIAELSGLSLATLILGTAPGGIAEMAITAKVLQLGVPLVIAFQIFRLVAVLLLVAPLYRWCYQRET